MSKATGDFRLNSGCILLVPGRVLYLEVRQNRLCHGFDLILRHPWFWRIWIPQEVANPRVDMIHCGQKSSSAQTFAQFPSLVEITGASAPPGCSRHKARFLKKRVLVGTKPGPSQSVDEVSSERINRRKRYNMHFAGYIHVRPTYCFQITKPH
jgi:hypothetical protein